MQFLVRKLAFPVLLLIAGVAYDGYKHDDLLYRLKDHGVHDAVRDNSAEFPLYDTLESYADTDDKEGCDEIGWNIAGGLKTQEEIDEIGVCFSDAQADITCYDITEWENESSTPLSADERLITCSASVWNTSDKTITASPDDFTLVSNQGERIAQGSHGHDDVPADESHDQIEVAPSESVQGQIYFLTPSAGGLPFLVEWKPPIEDENALGVFIVDEFFSLAEEE
jgi:hypothetical protein